MNPSLASLIFACGIAGLFYLDRDKSLRTSKALWLPVIYFWIIGSRPVSTWLGISLAPGTNAQLDGNPFDAAIYGLLLIATIVVLLLRSQRTCRLLAANWPIVVYFLYCLISVAWSSHPDVALKRWIKALDDLTMCLVIVTDRQPGEALKRLIARVGFVLLPASLLLIKYYGNLGRGYSPDGVPANTGVTTNKNVLGVMLFVISLYTLWRVITLLRNPDQPNRGRHLLAQGVLLAFGAILLKMADSKTSIACFLLGGGIIFVTGLRAIKRRPARVHLLCLGVFLFGGLTMFFGGESGVTQVMGRQSDLSGRTDIWTALIAAAPNPIIGAGFESFWISPSVQIFQHALLVKGWWHPAHLNEAHDGYLEVYLNLGIIGVGLIAWILLSGYKWAVAAYRRSPSIGGLMIAYIIVSAFYNITEAGFRMLDLQWTFLLLVIFSASSIAAGLFGEKASKVPASRNNSAKEIPAGKGPELENETVYAFQLIDQRTSYYPPLSNVH
jgi:exopolysaccharide production protein ExoQ